MKKLPEISGRTFGQLAALALGGWHVSAAGKRYRLVRCRCSCGTIVEKKYANLKNRTASCGCLRRGRALRWGFERRVHGESRLPDGKRTPEYQAWVSMINRCTNPKRKEWDNYGGRGIAICAEWRDSYEAFLAHVGRRPSPEYSLDRYPDNDGNYEPGNVRWATKKEQRANQRPKEVADGNRSNV